MRKTPAFRCGCLLFSCQPVNERKGEPRQATTVFKTLQENENVEYDFEDGPKGMKATKVRRAVASANGNGNGVM